MRPRLTTLGQHVETSVSLLVSMDGILLIDKPADIGSAKIGHLGTLDPFATGLLPILIGEATKIAKFLEHHEKDYVGVIALGAQTDTLDCTGQVISTEPVPCFDQTRLDEIARQFTGEFEQVPPLYSAIKRSGVPLYKLARKGAEPEPPPPRVVHVRRLQMRIESSQRLRFSVQCGTGMYVRSLARDIGNALGTVAYLDQLRRAGTGGFSIAQAIALDQALAMFDGGRAPLLIGLNQALSDMPAIETDPDLARRVRNGDASGLLEMVKMGQGPFKVVCRDALIAITQFGPDGRLGLARVFAG